MGFRIRNERYFRAATIFKLLLQSGYKINSTEFEDIQHEHLEENNPMCFVACSHLNRSIETLDRNAKVNILHSKCPSSPTEPLCFNPHFPAISKLQRIDTLRRSNSGYLCPAESNRSSFLSGLTSSFLYP